MWPPHQPGCDLHEHACSCDGVALEVEQHARRNSFTWHRSQCCTVCTSRHSNADSTHAVLVPHACAAGLLIAAPRTLSWQPQSLTQTLTWTHTPPLPSRLLRPGPPLDPSMSQMGGSVRACGCVVHALCQGTTQGAGTTLASAEGTCSAIVALGRVPRKLCLT